MGLLRLHRSQLQRARDRAADEQASLADIAKKISRKRGELERTKSPSRAQSLSRDLERLGKQQANAEKSLATAQEKISSLSEKVTRDELQLRKQDEREQLRAARAQQRARAALERRLEQTTTEVSGLHERVSDIEAALLDRVRDAVASDPVPRKFDVFLSHTDPDKDIAAELYAELTARDLKVWFDGAVMRLGESLTRQIDRGIAASRVGVILITAASLKGRFWSERELGALISTRRRVIPILDGVDREQLGEYSPLLADLVGLSTEHEGFDSMADQIAAMLVEAESEA